MDNEEKIINKQKQENTVKKRKKFKTNMGFTQDEKRLISKLNEISDSQKNIETENEIQNHNQKNTPKSKKIKKRCNSRSLSKSPNVNRINQQQQPLNKSLKKELDSKIEKESQGYFSDVNMKKVSNNLRKKTIIAFRKKMRYILGTMRYNILLKKYYYHWRNLTYKEKSGNKKVKQTYRNPIIYGPVEHNNDDDYDDSEETQNNNNKFLMEGQLEEIEERAADEEESVATSVQSKVRYNNRNTNILILRKIIKYKNILHRYFRQWYGMVGVGMSLQEYKKLRKSTKLSGSTSGIKRSSPKNSTTNANIHQTIMELDVESYTPEKMAKIQNNIIKFFELGGFKERIEKKYYNIWYRKTIKNNLSKNPKLKKIKAANDDLNNNNNFYKKKNNNSDPIKILKKLFIKINDKNLLYHFFKKWNFIIKNISEDSKRSIKPHIKIQKKDLNKNITNNKIEKKTKTKKPLYDNFVTDNSENNPIEERKSLTDSRVFYNSNVFHKKIEPNEMDEKKVLHPNKSRDDSVKKNVKKFKATQQNTENNIKMKIDYEDRPKYKINPFKITENENNIKNREILEKIKFTKFRHKKNKNQRFLIYNSIIKNNNKKEKKARNSYYNNDKFSENLLKKLNTLLIKKWIRDDKKAKYFDKWFDSTFNNPKYLPFSNENYQSKENSSNKVKFTKETKNNEKHSLSLINYMNRGKDSMLNLKDYDETSDRPSKKKSIRKKKKEVDNKNIKNNINTNSINYSKDDEINPDIQDIEIMQNDEPDIQNQKLDYIYNDKFARQLLKILYKNYQQRLKINHKHILKKYLHKWKNVVFSQQIQNYNIKIFRKKIQKLSFAIKKIIFKRIRIYLSLKVTRSNTIANGKYKRIKKPSIDWHELSKDDLRSDSNIKTTNSNEEEDNFGQSSSNMDSFVQKIENLMKRKDSNGNSNSNRNVAKKIKTKKISKKNKLLSEIIKKLIIKENNLKTKFYFDCWIKYLQKIKQKKLNNAPKPNKSISKKIYNNKKIKQDINLLDSNDNNEIAKKSFSSSESNDNNNNSSNNNNTIKVNSLQEILEYQDKQGSLFLPSIKNKSMQKLVKENKLTYDQVINNMLIKNKESFSSLTSGSNIGNEESKNDTAGKKNNITRRSLQKSNLCTTLSNGEEKKMESDKSSSTTKSLNINKYNIEKNKYISDINKLKCENIKIMNKNYEIVFTNSKKYEKIKIPGYLEILKKQNKINSAYQIFCIYALFKDNNKNYTLKKLAFNKWKHFCIFNNTTNKVHIQNNYEHCIKCNCNENKYSYFSYSNCDKCSCKKINKMLKKTVIKFKFLKCMNPKKYYFYFWKNN